MRRNRTTQSNMTETELRSAVEALSGDWTVHPVMGSNIRLRWVARREQPEKDEETGRPIEPTRQFESRVDAEDLLSDLARRNLALGIEKEATHA